MSTQVDDLKTATLLLESLVARPAPLHMDKDGVIRVGGTRVTLDTVIGAYHNGCVPEEIHFKYPSLKVDDIYAVITYYQWHKGAVDRYLEVRRQQADQMQQENEARFPSAGIRERLLARRADQS